MKKWIFGLLIAAVLVVAGIYLLVPTVVKIKTARPISVTSAAIHRMLLDKKNVSKWWPGEVRNDSFYLNGRVYEMYNNNVTLLPVSVKGKGIEITTSIFLVSIVADSTNLVWVGSMPPAYDPFNRLRSFLEANKLKRDMELILQQAEKFYSKPQNIYGFDIRTTLVTDSLLIVTNAESRGYPSNQFIYDLVNKLRNYAIANGVRESGFPMLNVGTADSITYFVKVGLPINKKLASSGDILEKTMPGRLKILVTEVIGGSDVTLNAYQQIQKYAEDHSFKTVAIPFYSLVTDRVSQPDSSKWITRIYYPAIIYN